MCWKCRTTKLKCYCSLGQNPIFVTETFFLQKKNKSSLHRKRTCMIGLECLSTCAFENFLCETEIGK